MHEHLSTLNESSSVPKNTGIILFSLLTGKLILVTSLPLGEERKQQPQTCNNANRVIQQTEAKVTLPFLGRSQSLLNIPLNLDLNQQPVIEPKVAAVQQTSSLKPTVAAPQPARRSVCSSSKRNTPKTDTKYQSLPHSSKEGHKLQQHHRREASSTMPHPVRSKSVEAKSAAAAAAQQHQYDISQLELFATIHQSRQAVSSRSNSKNLTVTSALVGVRQSDRNGTRTEQKNGKSCDPIEKGAPAGVKNPSGHVCVVQALVHQDGDVLRNSTATANAQTDTARTQQRPRNWEPVYEPLAGNGVRPKSEADSVSASEASIELTADQVRQLIRAISAAQSGSGGSIGGCWSSEMGRQPSNNIPERDVSVKQSTHQQRPLHRNDSFEGHEEAVRMLVGAIQEIQQLCTDKKQGEHP